MSKRIIMIHVEDGMIQDISDIPEDIETVVMDFDCDTYPDPDDPDCNIKENEDGDCYWESVYGAGE